LLRRSNSDFIDISLAAAFLGNTNSLCSVSEELIDNAPNRLTSIGVEHDLREEPDKSLKLSSGLSSYDDAESSVPRQAQQHRPIRATNAIQATDKPAITVPLLSLLLPFGSGLEPFLILVTSGRASDSKDKTLLIACFSEGGGGAMADAPSSKSLFFIAKGGLILLELRNKFLVFSCCFCCPCSEKGELCLFKQSRKMLATSAGNKLPVIASSTLIFRGEDFLLFVL